MKKIGNDDPRKRKNQFKKGLAPHNAKPADHEHVRTDGYIEIRVPGRKLRVLKHKWLWEQANGPVPEGMMLKALDGNKLNTDPSNWELISRAILPLLNGGRAAIAHYKSEGDFLCFK